VASIFVSSAGVLGRGRAERRRRWWSWEVEIEGESVVVVVGLGRREATDQVGFERRLVMLMGCLFLEWAVVMEKCRVADEDVL
jgi:hypothetical protein